MRNIWVISDTHFLHKNILTFETDDGKLIRGSRFNIIEEHDEHIIENWNKVVKPQDIIYHLGDVYFGPLEKATSIIKRLNGKKRLIVGNHDNIKQIVKNDLFSKVQTWRMFPEFGLLLTHVPVDPSSLESKKLYNVHGHIHERPSPTDQHINVCVEILNFKPINLEELRIR